MLLGKLRDQRLIKDLLTSVKKLIVLTFEFLSNMN